MSAKGSTALYSLPTSFWECNGTCRKCFHQAVLTHPSSDSTHNMLPLISNCSQCVPTAHRNSQEDLGEPWGSLAGWARRHCTWRKAERCHWMCMLHLRQHQGGEVLMVMDSRRKRIRGENWVAEQWKQIRITSNEQRYCTEALRRARQQKTACKGHVGLWTMWRGRQQLWIMG